MTINKISKTSPKSLGYIGSRGKVEILVNFSNENLEEEFAITMFDLGFFDTSVQEESDKYKGGICTCYMIERCEIDEFNAAYKIAKENSLIEASAKDSAIVEDDSAIAEEEPESKFTNALDNDNYFLSLSELPLLASCNSEGCNSFIVMKDNVFDIEVISPCGSLTPGYVSFLVSPYISKYEARELIKEAIELYSSLPDDPCDNALLLQDIRCTILDRSYSIALE